MMENSGAAVISWCATCLQISFVKTMLSRSILKNILKEKINYVLSLIFLLKDDVGAKSQIPFFTSLTGVLRGRKNKRDIFLPS